MATYEGTPVDDAIAAELATLRLKIDNMQHLVGRHGAQGIEAARAKIGQVQQAVADELRRASGGSPAGIPATLALTKIFGEVMAALGAIETAMRVGDCACERMDRVRLIDAGTPPEPARHAVSATRPSRHLRAVPSHVEPCTADCFEAASPDEIDLPEHLTRTFDPEKPGC